VAKSNNGAEARANKSRARRKHRPAIALIGAGNLATALGRALVTNGYTISEVIVRPRPQSLRRAKLLANELGASSSAIEDAQLNAEVLWLCVSDDAIAACASALAQNRQLKNVIALHSSGALSSSVLAPLQKAGAKVGSVHPMMTFVPEVSPSLEGVWFGVEGDPAAVAVAEQIVRDLHGEVLRLTAESKILYHAWGAFSSPLLIATLAAAEEVARGAGISASAARSAMSPIVQRTIHNYLEHGAASAFSGPLPRGDVATVAHHLEGLRALPWAQEIYVALARSALRTLPVRNRDALKRLLGGSEKQ
jgi:predicted short-subunit dehydrogenase-like oxidoreductase (DUF2520 family)